MQSLLHWHSSQLACPSSQSSPESTTPSPQRALMQFVRQAAPGSSELDSTPSSHSSRPPTMPSPQTVHTASASARVIPTGSTCRQVSVSRANSAALSKTALITGSQSRKNSVQPLPQAYGHDSGMPSTHTTSPLLQCRCRQQQQFAARKTTTDMSQSSLTGSQPSLQCVLLLRAIGSGRPSYCARRRAILCRGDRSCDHTYALRHTAHKSLPRMI